MIVRASAPVRIDFAGAWTDCPAFADLHGGATLTAAIGPRVEGVFEVPDSDEPSRLTYTSAAPVAAGLGSSAAMNVVWLGLARREPVRTLEEQARIAELAFEVERTLGILGGRQDQYSSACGGLRLYRFGAEGTVVGEALPASDAVEELFSRMVLLWTGRSRLSSRVHQSVWGRYAAGVGETRDALFGLRDSAPEALKAIVAGDLAEVGRLLDCQEAWMLALSPDTSVEGLDALRAELGGRLLGAKPTGAGGGGCVLLLVSEPRERAEALASAARLGWRELPLACDHAGLIVEFTS